MAEPRRLPRRWMLLCALLGAIVGLLVDDRFQAPTAPDPALWQPVSEATWVADGVLVLGRTAEGRDRLVPLEVAPITALELELEPGSPPVGVQLGELKVRIGDGSWGWPDQMPTSVAPGPMRIELSEGRATLHTPDGPVELGRAGTELGLQGVLGDPRIRSLRLSSAEGVLVEERYRDSRARVLSALVGAVLGLIAGTGGPSGLVLGLGAVGLALLPDAAWSALALKLRLVQAPTWVIARGALLVAMLPVLAAALMGTKVLEAPTEAQATDRRAVGLWAATLLVVTALLSWQIGWLWSPLILLVMGSSAIFAWRAGLLSRPWLLRDLPALLVALLPGGIVLTPLWRFLAVAANARGLLKRAARPSTDHLFLQLPLVLLAAELALRSAAVPEVGLGANFLAGAVLAPPAPEMFGGRTLAPNVTVEVSGLEYQTTVRTNERGLRGPPVPQGHPGPNGPLRLLTLGDSFTLAMEVEDDETFTALLGERLAESHPEGVLAWNAGVPDFSTFEAAEALPRLARELRPDVVVLSFYMGNDPIDNAKALEGGPDIAHQPPPGPLDVAKERALRFGSNSVLFSQVSVFFVLLQGEDEAVVRGHRDEIAVAVDPLTLSGMLEPTEQALAQFGQVCRSQNLVCLVGIIPPAYVVHQERAAATYSTFGIDPATADPDRNIALLRDAAPEHLPTVDLAEALRAANDQRLYYSYDVHWTTAGHQVVAEAYAEALEPLLSARARPGGGPRGAGPPRRP